MTAKPDALRPYQQECVQAVHDAFALEGINRALYCMATGTGKTRVMMEIARDQLVSDEFKRPVLLTAHREELVQQMANAAMKQIPEARVGIEAANDYAKLTSNVIIASIPTIGRKGSNRLNNLRHLGCALLFIDEAHHGAADSYMRVAEEFGAFDSLSRLVGCTATNHRLDQKLLVKDDGEALFEKQVYDYNLVKAIRDGWLCRLKAYKVVTGTDISQVGKVGDDFNQGQLAKAVDKEQRTKKAVQHWKEVAADRITVVFCASVAHAQHAAAAWKSAGVAADYVYGDMDPVRRKQVLEDWKAGRIQVVCNCGILTEGFDYPNISCVVMLRPTQSWSLFMQCIGRGTRICEGKTDCIILDVVDNTGKHSVVTAPAMLGMDPDLDPEGADLLEMKDEVDEAKRRGKRIEPMSSHRDIQTSLRQVNLIEEAALPASVNRFSSLMWAQTGDGYVLSLGKNMQDQLVSAKLWRDTLGAWRLGVTGKNIANEFGRADVPDFRRVDTAIRYMFPQSIHLVTKDSRWGKEPVTPAQTGVLRKAGVPGLELAQLNKQQASILISKMKEGWRYPK